MIYLDNSATTRTLPQAAQRAMEAMTETYFNPAAAYSPAVAMERAMNAARTTLASAIGASAEELYFTSGGTESNNMAIFGALEPIRGRGRIIVGATEHPSVFEPFQKLARQYDMQIAWVDGQGCIDLNGLEKLLTPDTLLVSIMQVNNEVGAINDIPSIRRLMRAKAPGALLHVDGVQGYLKVPFSAKDCDLYSISGHKFHAPKGVGALICAQRDSVCRRPAWRRPGKGRAQRYLQHPGHPGHGDGGPGLHAKRHAYRQQMLQCKQRLYAALTRLPDVVYNGPALEAAAPHILNLSFLGVGGEVLLHALEDKGIYVSTGSACSAHKKGKNRILNAMGVIGERQEGAIRFSFSHENTLAEMDQVAEAIDGLLPMLRRFRRR